MCNFHWFLIPAEVRRKVWQVWAEPERQAKGRQYCIDLVEDLPENERTSRAEEAADRA